MIVVNQNVVEKKKESIFSRIVNGFKNFILKANWTLWYYGLVTVGLISLFNKLEVFNSSEVYENIKNKDYGIYFNSFWTNVKNLPDNVKLIYQSLKKDQTNEELYNKLCNDSNENSKKSATCQIVKLLNSPKNSSNVDVNATNKFSDILRSLSKTQQPVVDAMDYFKIHGTLIWVGSLVGSAIGILGSAVGAFNIGGMYGMVMIPYLWSFKDKNKGDLEILANGIDFAGNLWQNSTSKFIKNQTSC